MSHEKIAFIGFGLSGVSQFCTYIDEAIARQQKPHVIIFEKNVQRFATGFPYEQTTPELWTLNGPPADSYYAVSNGKSLSVWLHETRNTWSKKYNNVEEQYPPRALIGEYIKATYIEYKQKALDHGIQIEERFEEVINLQKIKQQKFLLQTKQDEIKVDFIGLGIGHLPSDNFQEFINKPNFIDNPWNTQQLNKIPKNASEVIIIGGNLTFVDVSKYLILVQDFKGAIISVTRHPALILFRDNTCPIPPEPIEELLDIFHASKKTKLPLKKAIFLFWQAYLKSAKNPIEADINTLRTEASITYVLTSQLAVYDKTKNPNLSQGDFSELLNFVKAFVASHCYKAMWNALTAQDQRDFLKYYYSAIVAYFVGVPALNARFLNEMFATKRIQKLSGMTGLRFDEINQKYILTFKDGSEKKGTYVINATGQGLDITKHLAHFPLLENLLKQQLIKVVPYGGIVTNDLSQVLNAQGEAMTNFIAIGPSVFNYGVPAPEGSHLINAATSRAYQAYFAAKDELLVDSLVT